VEVVKEKKRKPLGQSIFNYYSQVPDQKDDEGGSGSITRANGRRSRRLVLRRLLAVVCSFADSDMKGTREFSAPVVLVGYEHTSIFSSAADTDNEEEQLKMNDCYSDHKDWRVCKEEVSA
jgi:hypothetical protein